MVCYHFYLHFNVLHTVLKCLHYTQHECVTLVSDHCTECHLIDTICFVMWTIPLILLSTQP